jgi:hypothetical protein
MNKLFSFVILCLCVAVLLNLCSGLVTIRAGLLSRFSDVLVAFYLFRLVERLALTFVTAMRIGTADLGSTLRWIPEYRLSRFTVGTGYDKVPL